MQRKRILVFTSTFPRWNGDSEPSFIFELSTRLANQFDILVLAPHTKGAKYFEKMGEMNVHRFFYLPFGWERLAYEGGILANLKKHPINYLALPVFLLCEYGALIRLLRKYPVDVIHAHWLIPQGLIALAARIFAPNRPAVLCTSHGSDLFGLSGRLFTFLKRWVIQHVDQFTVVSNFLRNYALSLSEKVDIETIPMGVDTRNRFTPTSDIAREASQILFVGRLIKAKGAHLIIDAMSTVLTSHPDATLVIAGDGPERSNLKKLISEKRLEKHVQLVGSIPNHSLTALYRRAAMLVAPSEAEGLGLVSAEALACECPVIAADLPSVREVVLNGITGLICQQKSSEDLARKIQTLLMHPEFAVSLGQAGRLHIMQNLDWKIVAQRYGATITKLTAGNHEDMRHRS